jgi:putative peptide maturation system protein
MNDNLQQATTDTLDYLRVLVRDGIRPTEARARLRLIQQKHPDTDMDLLWEEEAYDQSVHYDALLHLPGQGTVSLSFCPDRALPWPMRGVHRWSERDLVRVNNTVLQVAQAMACLDFIWDEAPITHRLINVCLIQEELAKNPIDLSDAELQQAMDAFRQVRKLYTAEDTYWWMARRGMTHDQLERLVADEAMVAKLRDRVTAGLVEAYFEEHRVDFDTADIARFACSDEASARHTCEQIRCGELDFYEAAQRCFMAAERSKHPSHALFAVVQRGHVSPALATAIFTATPGAVVGPVHTEEGYAIVRVLSYTPTRLNEPTRGAIKRILFEQWLAERREAATIEWYWGNAGRTSQAA